MARRSAVRIEGISELQRDLKRVATDVEDLREVHTEVGQIVAEEGQQLVPKLTNALEGTIRPIPSRSAATIRAGGAGIEYAGVIHFGWPERNIEPVPYLYDAADRRSAEVVARYEAGIDRITDRHI